MATIFWRDFLVTSTGDSGPGTLRQAILDINAGCSTTWCRAVLYDLGPEWSTSEFGRALPVR